MKKLCEFSSSKTPLDEILDFYGDAIAIDTANKLYCWSNSISTLDGVQHFMTGKTVTSIGLGHITDNQKADHRLLQASWSFADAILISGQICRDEEDLDCRIYDQDLIDYRIASGRGSAPVVIILSRSGDISFDRPLFNRVGQRVEIYTSGKGVESLEPLLKNVKSTVKLNEFEGNLSELFNLLFTMKVRYLDISTGGSIINDAINLELLDEIRWTQSGAIAGPSNSGGFLRPKLWSGTKSYDEGNHPLIK